MGFGGVPVRRRSPKIFSSNFSKSVEYCTYLHHDETPHRKKYHYPFRKVATNWSFAKRIEGCFFSNGAGFYLIFRVILTFCKVEARVQGLRGYPRYEKCSKELELSIRDLFGALQKVSRRKNEDKVIFLVKNTKKSPNGDKLNYWHARL